MINLSYNVHIQSPDFQLFQNWNHFNYSLCIRELKVCKFDQDDRKMGDLARLSFKKESLLVLSLGVVGIL